MGSASLTAVSFVNEIKFGLCLEDSFSVFFDEIYDTSGYVNTWISRSTMIASVVSK